MKHIILVLFTSLIPITLFSQGIAFEQGTFTEALEKAKKEDKILFMDAYTVWCGPCKMMSKDVFPQKQVGDFFNEHFVSIKMDMEQGEGVGLRETYDVNSFPTLLFIDADGKEIHKLIGGMYAEDLIKGAKNVLDPNKRLPALTKRYENGERSFDFMVNYIEVLYGARDDKGAENVAKEFVSSTSITEFDDKDMFQILALSKIKYGSSDYWYLVNREEYLIPKVGEEVYFQVLDGAIRNYLFEKAETVTTIEELNAAIFETRQDRANEFFQKRMENNLKYTYYLSQKNFTKWFDLKMEEAKDKQAMEYIFFIHDFGTEIINNPIFNDSKASYDRILKLAHDIVDEGQGTIMGSFLLAKLYLKTENKAQASKYFDMFFESNEAAGGNNTHVTVTDLKKAIDSL